MHLTADIPANFRLSWDGPFPLFWKAIFSF